MEVHEDFRFPNLLWEMFWCQVKAFLKRRFYFIKREKIFFFLAHKNWVLLKRTWKCLNLSTAVFVEILVNNSKRGSLVIDC